MIIDAFKNKIFPLNDSGGFPTKNKIFPLNDSGDFQTKIYRQEVKVSVIAKMN